MADEVIPLDYASATLGQLVVIAAFEDQFEIRLAATRLEAEGIAALVNEQMRLPHFGVRGATLAVHQADVADAVEILSQTPAKRLLIDRGQANETAKEG